jgi:hypothetical protein
MTNILLSKKAGVQYKLNNNTTWTLLILDTCFFKLKRVKILKKLPFRLAKRPIYPIFAAPIKKPRDY